MKWLARLKTENAPEAHATTATNTPNVAFVASIPGLSHKTTAVAGAANDLAPDLKKSEFSSIRITRAPASSAAMAATFQATSQALNEADSASVQTTGPDHGCWPDSPAMNAREIDTFTRRLERFTRKGLRLADAEALADTLVRRDRETDDRRLCLECRHLQGGVGRWHCGNGLVAGVTLRAADAQLPGELARQLQRCAGFPHEQGAN